MKKFISALSSFVIAATALGGSLAMSTTAATNGNVSETIIDIQSNGSNEVKDAKAGDKIPFKVYVPQSNGFNQIALKFSVNGDKTRGQDPSLCDGATSYTLTKNTKLGSAGQTITHPELFGNYGITIDNWKFSDPVPIDSKYYKPNDYWKAGNPNSLGQAVLNQKYWGVIIADGALNSEVNVDSYAAAEAAGLDRNADEDAGDPIFDYSKYTPVTTWTSDEAWAYKYSLIEGEFKLPSSLPDGTYVIDVFKGEYVNANFLEDFRADGTLPTAESDIADTAGSKAFSSKPLTIVVGEGGTTEETTTKDDIQTTTTTSSSSSSTPEGDGIILDLVAAGKTNTLKNGVNVAEVEAGSDVKVNLTIKNDTITSGMEFTFDLDGLTYVADSLKAGRAYEAEMETNDDVAGQLTFVIASNLKMTAKDGATIVTFTVKAPASGEKTIGLKSGARALVAGFNKGDVNPYTFHGLTLKVVGDAPETTTTETTIPQTGDGIILDLVAAGKTNTLKNGVNVAEVEAGSDVKVNFTIKNDTITSGMEFTFDLGGLTYVADSLKAGRAYEAEMETNDDVAGQLTFVIASNLKMTAKDGATIVTFTVKAPASGEKTIGLKSGARALVAGFNKGDTNPYTFHGLTLKVVEAGETTTTETTTTTTETTIPQGDVVWGDTNCDGEVTIADVVLLNKHLAKNATVSPQGQKNANCQNDSKLDTKDAACIKGYLALVIKYEVLGQADAYETLQSFYNAETGNYK